MRRTKWIALVLVVVVLTGLLAGCEGTTEQEWGIILAALLGNWTKTFRSVDGVEENPIGWPMTMRFDDDGHYNAFNDLGYNEEGTWGVDEALGMLILNMTANNNGQPVPQRKEWAFTLVDDNHFQVVYESSTGGGFVEICEIYELQPPAP